MVDIRQLECFVAVVEEGHFGRAAQRLNMTQPPLSRQIQNLEQSLQVQLLDRSSRAVQLTYAGRKFLPEAMRVLSLLKQATLNAKRANTGTAGEVRVGFTAAAGYGFIPSLLLKLRVEAPGLSLVMRDMLTLEQVEALLSDEIDVGFIGSSIRREGILTQRVLQEPMYAAIPVGHRLANLQLVDVREFDGEDFLMYSPYGGGFYGTLLTALFQNYSIAPNHVQYVRHPHTVMALAQAGMGCGLVPLGARNIQYAGVAMRPVKLPDDDTFDIFMIWRADSDSPPLETFITAACRSED